MALYLGLDIGTTAVKAVVIDATGSIVAEAARSYGYSSPRPGWIEQTPADWERLAGECVQEISERLTSGLAHAPPTRPFRPTAIKALALSTQGDTVTPLDEKGQPLAPAVTWMDLRAQAEAEALAAEGELWQRVTGSRPGAYAAAAHILWWRNHQPTLFQRTHRFALVADYMIERLTGRPLLDAPNASRTLAFDIRTRRWAPELLARLGVREEQFAPVAEAGTIVGPVQSGMAQVWGLAPETLVVLGGHDQTCAAVGCGVLAPGPVMLSCGTAWVVLAATEQPVFDVAGRVQGYCHATPGGYAVLGAFAGGNLLHWFRETFGSAAGASGARSYEEIIAEAEEALQSQRPALFFLPYFYGATFPEDLPQARGGWLGLTLQHTRGDMALALLDGVALQTAFALEELRRLGVNSHELRMIGGGARSRFWAERVATMTGLPVARPLIREAAAYGAALIAAAAAGAFRSLEEARAQIVLRDIITPNGQPDRLLLRERQRGLGKALKPIWEALGRL